MAEYTKAQRACIEEHRDVNVDHDWWDGTVDCFKEQFELAGFSMETRTVRLLNGKTREDVDFSFALHRQGAGTGFGLDKVSVSTLLADNAAYVERCKAYGWESGEPPEDSGLAWELHCFRDYVTTTFAKYLCGPDADVLCHLQFGCENRRDSCSIEWEIDLSDIPDDHPLVKDAEASYDVWKSALRDFDRAMHKALDNEYDYLTSDEAVWDTIEANELFEDEEELEDAA